MTVFPRTDTRKPIEPSIDTARTQQWSSSLQTVLDQPASNLPAQMAVAGTIFCLIFSAWAWFGSIDEVASATGKLIPKDEVFKIHAIELGKVVNVAVKEGETVKAGQVLVELDTDLSVKEVERLEALLFALRTERVQLEGMRDGIRLQAQSQTAISEATVQSQQSTITQSKLTVDNSRLQLNQLQEDSAAQRSRLARLQPLYADGALPKEYLFEAEQRLRDRQRTITETQGNLDKTLVEINRSQLGLSEKIAEAHRSRLMMLQQIKELEIKLTELDSKFNESRVLLESAKTKLKQRFLYAPVTGVVSTLNLRQSGEVVQPGQSIAEIAPMGKPLVLSTVLPNQEAGFVKVGMPVQIKLDAYPFQEYGVISGRVMTISPDSKLDERRGQVYRVDVELLQHQINAKGQTIQFKPGQTAAAEIVTRQRRIADVLLDPFKKLQGTNL